MLSARLAWTALGFAALAVGSVGTLLPLLPTPPFVILAAFAFGKGSPRLRARLEAHRVFGPAIRDWKARGAIAPRHKVTTGLVMGLALLAACWPASAQQSSSCRSSAWAPPRPSS